MAAFPGAPIWSSNASSSFTLLRSPPFSLRAPAFASATLFFTAIGSPGTQGTLQAKLLGAACPHLNGVLLTCGPGHSVPTASQLVRTFDLAPYVRPDAPNVLGIAAFYNQITGARAAAPRVQAWVEVVDASGAYTLAASGADWAAAPNGDAILGPHGNAGVSWYYFPNENQDRRLYPLGWAAPDGAPPAWPPAAPRPPFPLPLYVDAQAAAPVLLQRSACAVTALGPGRQLIDYGQEFMGGVNLSFVGAAPGARVRVTLAEVLRPDGTVLAPMTTCVVWHCSGGSSSSARRCPQPAPPPNHAPPTPPYVPPPHTLSRSGNFWSSNWTLSGDAARDASIVHHEFIQFRYAQVEQDPAAGPVTVFTPATALAWVLQHPLGGDGVNPWEHACSASRPAARAWGAPARAPPATPLGAFASSSPALDTVFNFSAYTMAATAMDVNVDGQTRERDVDIVDSLINARGQYALFSPNDTSIARRTLREALGNDTGMWSQWYDFKASTVLLARDHTLYSGDLSPLADAYCSAPGCIAVPPARAYNSLQFLAGFQHYYNASGSGLMAFPRDGSCGGSWACEVLLDWPAGTRDGYDCGSGSNPEDTARSALGAMAIGALADAAAWVAPGGAGGAEALRYSAAAAGLRAALAAHNLRALANGSAYFVDGRTGAAAAHAAVHSTLFACAAGACDGVGADTARALVAHLVAHGVAPTSCMMGRWWVEALYRLGVSAAEGADAALGVLTAPGYPGWLDMLAQGASTTMEAWRPKDKSNLDWAHPWCASPAFSIVGGALGAVPLAPGWARWRAAPQPSALARLAAAVPTPGGVLQLAYAGAGTPQRSSNATLALTVAPGQGAQVCLAQHGAAGSEVPLPAARDGLQVDGAPAQAVPWGRFLCTQVDLGPGAHTVARITSS